jgi:hypothetical protein
VVEAGATKEDVLQIRNLTRLLFEDTDYEHTTVKIGHENEYLVERRGEMI